MEDVDKLRRNFFLFLHLSAVHKISTLGKLTYSRHFQRVVIIATKSEEVLIHFKSDLFASLPSPSSRCTDLVTVFAAILTIRQQLEISVLE